MSSTTITEGKLRILTFKEGLLSRVAHDLQLSAPTFRIDVDGEQVRAVVQTRELVVDGAMKNGTLQPRTLSDKDKRDIRDNVAKDVLRSSAYPEARFEGTTQGADGDRFRVEGQLELVGRKQPITFSAERRDGRLHFRTELIQSRWGIKPYSAMLGTLKVKDRIELHLETADPAAL